MGLNITKQQLANPLLQDLLRKLTSTFSRIDKDFFVIGATARDIILQVLADTSAHRMTRDLDIAIAVPDWASYELIQEVLIADGFKKSEQQKQRFFYDYYEVDVVPYGQLAAEDDYIYWPPEETVAMSVKGFDEILSKAITVSIDNEFKVKIASLHGLFLLKLNAWVDRHISTNKDAEDIWFIIDNYYFANDARGIHPEVYDTDEFDMTAAGAYWLAYDVVDLVSPKTLQYFQKILEDELSKGNGSRLFMQILETNSSVNYSEVRKVFNTMIDVFKKFTDTDK